RAVRHAGLAERAPALRRDHAPQRVRRRRAGGRARGGGLVRARVPRVAAVGDRRAAEDRMSPLSYNVPSLAVRKTSTIAAVIGSALVVAVFSAVLMLRNGIHDTMASSGRADNVLIMRFGSLAELSSGMDAAQVGLVGAKPQIARAPSGQPLIVGEVLVVILLDKAGTTG